MTDVGGALALLSRLVAARHPHLRFQSFDLPPLRVHAQVRSTAPALRCAFRSSWGTSLDPLPPADVVTMGNVLHDWNEEQKL